MTIQGEKRHAHIHIRGFLVCKRMQFCVDIITGKPASATFEFTVPPATSVSVEDVNDLPGSKREAGRALLVRDVVVHREDVVSFELCRIIKQRTCWT
jgi:hypothetical protein